MLPHNIEGGSLDRLDTIAADLLESTSPCALAHLQGSWFCRREPWGLKHLVLIPQKSCRGLPLTLKHQGLQDMNDAIK